MAHYYKRKKRNFFIKRDFQGRIILAVFLAVTIGCLLFILIFGLFSADTMTISYENSELQMGQTPVMLFKNALAANWIFILICGTLLVIAAIMGTHRIAGPLFHFEKTLDNMNKRNLRDNITLREKDEGKDLAVKLNTFNNVLSADIRSARKHTGAINDLLIQYKSIERSKLHLEDIESICRAIQKNNDKIRARLKPYQLADD